MSEQIRTNDLINELGRNFIEYAYAVNTDRAIPDARDGLKPVAKRILWSMLEEGRIFSKPHVKAARVVGDVMGRYHPHGDSSIYGAMVRLSQSWVMRYPLIDWHGSNGNISGDGPAAARYTEARLAKISEDGLLSNIKKNNIDFIANYDETLMEPICLPSSFPNLLCNPNSGIGVAMACSWAPHNLKEVAKAICDYIDGNKPIIPAPDFPTGGLIINGNECPDIISKGRGSIKIRARYKVDKNKIIFYEIPYGETIEGLLKELGEACDNKEIEGIIDARDESNKKGIRFVIEIARGIQPDAVAAKIYQKTNFQTSFSYNQVALVGKTPTELSLEDCCNIYVKHNQECLIKELTFDLVKATDRLEIVKGLLKALENIDNIIALIKSCDNSTMAKEKLIDKYDFTEKQAKAILAMKLSSLTKLDKVELNKEREELSSKIETLNDILKSQPKQLQIIKDRLQTLVKRYGDERKTEITNIEIKPEEKAKMNITPEDVVVISTYSGDIKRVPKKSFRTQHRKGVGVKTLDTTVKCAISTNTIETLMIFTSTGKMYKLLVDKIPEGTNASSGVNLSTLLPFEKDEKIQAITSDKEIAENVMFFTKNGLIKKTKIEEYVSIKRTTGIQAIKLKENDELINVSFIDNKKEVILITQNGMSIKVPTDDIKPIGRLTSGVKGIGLKDNDKVVSSIIVTKDVNSVIIATSKGKGKKIDISSFIIQNRGGRGVSCIKLDSDDSVAAAAATSPDASILILGIPNSICINSSEISNQTKTGSGTKIIDRSKIVSLVVL